MHGSGGNSAEHPRKTYVLAYRDKLMVEYERRIGFSHSYTNDPGVLEAIRRGDL